MNREVTALPFLLALFSLFAACSVAIDGEDAERDRATAIGTRYEKPFEERELPPLADDSDLAAYIAHAEVSNGELEAAFHEWLAAIEDVPQAATQDTTAMLGLEHTLDGGSALDRTGLMLMTDTMANWMFPGRLRDRGNAALSRARTAGAAFTTRRLALQSEIAERYVELWMRDREIALQERLASSLAMAAASARAEVENGQGSQRESTAMQASVLQQSANLAQLRTSRTALVARLLAATGSSLSTGLDPRPSLPDPQPLRTAEQAALDAAIARNPALQQARASHEAALLQITADEWEHTPQFSLRSLVMLDGSALIQPAMTLPFLRDHAISAKLRQTQSTANAANAMLRKAALDAAAAIVAERAIHEAAVAEFSVLAESVLPQLVRTATVARAEWTSGRARLREWLEVNDAATAVELELVRLRGTAAIARARLHEAMGEAIATGEGADDAGESFPHPPF